MLYITATTSDGRFYEYWVDEGEEPNALDVLDNIDAAISQETT